METENFLENEILSKSFISDYDLEECTIIAKMLMKKFHKLQNRLPEEVGLRITSNYKPIYSCPLPRRNNQMDPYDNKMDDVAEYALMNDKIKSVMNQMSEEECACFTEYLMHEKSESTVAKIVGRSRKGIIPLINSAVIRLVLAFRMEIRKGEINDIDITKEIQLKY